MAPNVQVAVLATVAAVAVCFLLLQGYYLLIQGQATGSAVGQGAGAPLAPMLGRRRGRPPPADGPGGSSVPPSLPHASLLRTGTGARNGTPAINATLLPVIHTKAYKHCYLHSSADTFAVSPANYVINDEFKFIYFEIPKVASTAIRTLIHKNVPGTPNTLHRGAWQLTPTQLGYFKFTCVRDPVDRFVSNFNFLSVFHDNLNSERAGDKAEVVAAMGQWLVRLAEEGWWNWHLWPQSLYLSHFDGAPRAINRIFDQSNLQAVADELHVLTGAPQFAVEKVDPFGGQYTASKKVLPSDLPDNTVVMICMVYLVDYCCFGFPLPAACTAAGMSCDAQRDEHDLLNLQWTDAASHKGQKAHLYQAEAQFLHKFKKSIGHT